MYKFPNSCLLEHLMIHIKMQWFEMMNKRLICITEFAGYYICLELTIIQIGYLEDFNYINHSFKHSAKWSRLILTEMNIIKNMCVRFDLSNDWYLIE
jgi:hypothetical protein